MRKQVIFIIFLGLCLGYGSAHAQGENDFQTPEKTKVARDGKAEDFDIRGIKVTMSIDDMIKIAENQGWDYKKNTNAIDSLVMCPKGIDCNSTMLDEPSGTFRLRVLYKNDSIYEIEYTTNISTNFDEISKLILNKYGMPLKKNPRDKSEYWYGINTKSLKSNTKLRDHWNYIRDHVFEVRIVGHDKGTPKENYTIDLHLANPPKIDDAAMKPIQPAL